MKDKGFRVVIIGLIVIIMIFVFSSRVLNYTTKIYDKMEKNSQVLEEINQKKGR
ncbi:hypothetical protein ACFL0U_01100 [Pseudomonadota bacterium]